MNEKYALRIPLGIDRYLEPIRKLLTRTNRNSFLPSRQFPTFISKPPKVDYFMKHIIRFHLRNGLKIHTGKTIQVITRF